MPRFCLFLLVFALCWMPLSADVITADQVNSLYWYSAASAQTVAAAASVFTVQVSGTNSKITYLRSLTVMSTVALTGVKLEVAGTAATATSGLVVKLNSSVTSTVVSYTASDVGTGTVVFTFDVPAGVPITLDLSGMTFASGSSTTRNATMRAPSATGTVYSLFKWGQGR